MLNNLKRKMLIQIYYILIFISFKTENLINIIYFVMDTVLDVTFY
jgi:hypothetical protein